MAELFRVVNYSNLPRIIATQDLNPKFGVEHQDDVLFGGWTDMISDSHIAEDVLMNMAIPPL